MGARARSTMEAPASRGGPYIGGPPRRPLTNPTYQDACFVEVANFWPKPEQLAELARHVRLGVMLREPWSRHESQYERDYFKAGLLAGPQSPGRYPPCPIESYVEVHTLTECAVSAMSRRGLLRSSARFPYDGRALFA
jgi:hypothetical protein